MKRLLLLLACWVAWVTFVPLAPGAEADLGTAADVQADREKATAATAAVAAVAATAAARDVHAPDFLENLVDLVLAIFNIHSSGNTAIHYVISALLLFAALVLRRAVTAFMFRQLRRVASRTETTLDDKLFDALEAPVGTFVMLVGIFASLKVLKLPVGLDRGLAYGSTVAFTLVVFWGLLRALSALLDHAQEIARVKQLGVAAFMPWIKKTLATIFVVFGVLLVIQSFGYDVKAILAGLGLGGLAFALAAQDTLANFFGSVAVAIDQPFKIGDTVRIGANEGTVEDIGLRSTKLRRVDKALIVMPNKAVAAEAVVNLARFTRRRVEQVIALTYDTKPEQMEAILEAIRALIAAEKEVEESSIMVFFRDLSASSLDIWIVYETPDPDFQTHMRVKQRLNLAIMRAVESGGLSFAYPTQTVRLTGGVAEKRAERDGPPRVASGQSSV